MTIELDQRRRAMLQEMQVRVWSPLAPARRIAPESPVLEARAVPVAPLPLRGPAPASPSRAGIQSADLQPDDAWLAGTQPADFPALAAAIAACEACALCEGRKAAVFFAPAQARQADWMVVGEPPSEEEERTGTAFAGPEGELVDNMLRAVQCSRNATGASGAWLTNVVKCRPALARNPNPQELARCARFLRHEVALVQPRVILAMGRFAAAALLSESAADVAKLPFARLRGRLHQFAGVPVVVTNSPARLLRAPLEKAGAWADLCLAQSTARRDSPPAAPGP